MRRIMDWTLALLLAAAFLIRLPFFLHSTDFMDFDEATFAAMARHILEGEFPIYIWGHSYSGSLTSFVMAPFLALLGSKALAIKLTAFTFFSAFIAIHYVLLKKIFSKTASVFASTLILLMPPGLLDDSMRVWGGHAELWPFAAAVLLCLFLYFDSPGSQKRKSQLLFLTGFFSGFGLWLNHSFFVYLFPCVIFFALRLRPSRESFFTALVQAFWLKKTNVPLLLRRSLVAFHFILGFYFLVQFAAMGREAFQGTWAEPLIRIFATDPPLRIKEMKAILFILIGEVVFLWMASASARGERQLRMKKAGTGAAGFTLGFFPALLFNILGGEGLRIFHKSGAISLAEFPLRARDIFLEKIPHFILGMPPYSSLSGPPEFRLPQTLGALLILGLLATAVIAYRKDFAIFGSPPQFFKPSYAVLFFLLGGFTVLTNLLSTLEAPRYLAPCYLALAAVLGAFLGQILWPRSKVLALLLAGLISGHYLTADFSFYREFPRHQTELYQQFFDYLNRHQIYGGLAPRMLSHPLTFLSEEKMVFAATSPQERYLPHEQYVNQLRRKALIFEKNEAEARQFQQDPQQMEKVFDSEIIGNYVIFLVKETDLQNNDLRYAEQVGRRGPRLFLNQ